MLEHIKEGQFSTRKAEKRQDPAELKSVGPDGKKVKPDSDFCVAKRVESKNQETRHYVKKLTRGNGFNLFNPLDDEIGSLSSAKTTDGRDRWEFTLVTEDSYNAYVQFLQTGNLFYLRNAERLL